MKRILNIIMLIIAFMFNSCKEDIETTRVDKKQIEKKVSNLSYSFNNSQEEDAVKSINDSSIKDNLSRSKVLSVETFEINEEPFTATLIEEGEPIVTKAPDPGWTPPQAVSSSNVYTFYSYNNIIIKKQLVNGSNNTIDVPDISAPFGMIFLSGATGMGNPVALSPTIDSPNKKLTYKVQPNSNENICYSIFYKDGLQGSGDLNVVFTPLFSQIGLEVASTLSGKQVTVNEFSLESGVQASADVTVTYSSNAIGINYPQTANATISCNINNTTNPITLSGGYYNVIPNGKTAKIKIKLSVAGVSTQEKTISLNKPFERGRRYKLVINNVAVYKIYTDDAYYMWDAPVDGPYSTTNGGAIQNYNNGDGYAYRSCANAPRYYEIEQYLAADVYWVEDGPAYKLPDGKTYRTGLMVRKKDYIPNFGNGAKRKDSVTPITTASYKQLEYGCFFLPAAGTYGGVSYYGNDGCYWSSSPGTTYTNYGYNYFPTAYTLYFNKNRAYVAHYTSGGMIYGVRYHAYVPMVGYDPTYKNNSSVFDLFDYLGGVSKYRYPPFFLFSKHKKRQ